MGLSERPTLGARLPLAFALLAAVHACSLETAPSRAQRAQAHRYDGALATPGGVSALVLAAMDRSVDPCDDFYRYACGGWMSENRAPFNQAVIPIGIARPPLFATSLPPPMNYGALGVIVGHEIAHALDNVGRGFDAEAGNRIDVLRAALVCVGSFPPCGEAQKRGNCSAVSRAYPPSCPSPARRLSIYSCACSANRCSSSCSKTSVGRAFRVSITSTRTRTSTGIERKSTVSHGGGRNLGRVGGSD